MTLAESRVIGPSGRIFGVMLTRPDLTVFGEVFVATRVGVFFWASCGIFAPSFCSGRTFGMTGVFFVPLPDATRPLMPLNTVTALGVGAFSLPLFPFALIILCLRFRSRFSRLGQRFHSTCHDRVLPSLDCFRCRKNVFTSLQLISAVGQDSSTAVHLRRAECLTTFLNHACFGVQFIAQSRRRFCRSRWCGRGGFRTRKCSVRMCKSCFGIAEYVRHNRILEA